MDKFKIVENGYSVTEVNKFVDDVIAQTEQMLEKMKKQHRDNEELRNNCSANPHEIEYRMYDVNIACRKTQHM